MTVELLDCDNVWLCLAAVLPIRVRLLNDFVCYNMW